jgi:NAD kinase
MFSKVFISWKRNYGEKIALRVCAILREAGIGYAMDEPKGCDLAVTVGGDGTLLKFQSSLECPILGINPGASVGFYLSANAKDFERKLRRLLDGEEGEDYYIKEFMRLETTINKVPVPFLALNEVLISPVYVRRAFVTELNAKGKRTKEINSGILVYTASGSHAYAKATGARPLREDGKFGIAAIAPYAGRLAKGELILEKGQASVKCLNNEGEVCVDGSEEQVCRLKAKDVVVVKKSARPAKIVWFGK